MSEIKPIETFYNGYRFRSRLEARWAVFFDAACLEYEYEPEGYTLANGEKYLPDFYLPKFDLFVEVKRDTEQGRMEIRKKCLNAFSWGGPIKQILILSDVPYGSSVDGGIWHFPILFWHATGVRSGWWFFHNGTSENGLPLAGNISGADYPDPSWYLIGRKKSIKAVSDYELRSIRNPKWISETDFSLEEHIDMQNTFNLAVFQALTKARQARFEHGETPTI